MEFYRGDIIIKNKYKYKNLDIPLIFKLSFFYSFLQKHKNFNIKHFIDSEFFNYKKIMRMFFLSRTFRNVGLIINWGLIELEHRLHSKRTLKFFQSTPIRWQRTRTNAITTQKNIGYGWTYFAKNLSIKRRSLKTRFALSKKKNKPLKKKLLKVKTTKSKAPVKRSRDSKKSVWG